MSGDEKAEVIEVRVKAHAGIRARCSKCRRPSPGYDQLPERRWLFVPLWGISVWVVYAPRRGGWRGAGGGGGGRAAEAGGGEGGRARRAGDPGGGGHLRVGASGAWTPRPDARRRGGG